MASLMEEFIATLRGEQEIYQQLIPISEQKTKVLVEGDLTGLERVTGQEQELLDRVYNIDKHREKILSQIGVVLNRKPEELDLTTLARLMERQPKEQKELHEIHDALRQVMKRLVSVNEKNKDLIENSLEMIEFNMNFIQSTRMSPGSNNYTKSASTNYMTDVGPGSFDAKQ